MLESRIRPRLPQVMQELKILRSKRKISSSYAKAKTNKSGKPKETDHREESEEIPQPRNAVPVVHQGMEIQSAGKNLDLTLSEFAWVPIQEKTSVELNEDKGLSEEDQYLLSVFEKPNVVLKVGNERLHVKKEQLMVQSVVFEKMFNSDFKEAKADEISFPEKNPLTFTKFLRYLLPGFPDTLEEDIVHDILLLVQEYQTDSLLKRIDTMLAVITKTRGCEITTDRIIQNILEAEQYDMQKYLVECINVASKKFLECLTNNLYFSYVTQDTKLKICMQRISLIDSVLKRVGTRIPSATRYMVNN